MTDGSGRRRRRIATRASGGKPAGATRFSGGRPAGGTLIRTLTLGGLAVAGLVALALPAAAQEGGRTARLSFDQSLRVTDNPGFVPDPDEGGIIARTSLGFALTTATRVDRLSFDVGSFVEFGDATDDGFQSPTAGLSYARQGATQRFGADVRWRQTDVRTTFALPFDEPIDAIEDDPVEDPPADAPPVGDDDITFDEQDLVTDDGTLSDIRAGARFDTGVGTPTELSFGVDYRRRDYSGTTDPDLFDDERVVLSAGADLRINPAVTGIVDTRYELYDTEDATDTERRIYALGAGAGLRLDAALGVETLLFYDRVETTRSTGETTDEGIGARLRFTLDRPQGAVTGELRTQVTATGRRDALRIGRSFALREGTLSGSVGAIRFDDGEIRPAAELRFARPLRSGALSVSLNQTAAVDDDDRNVIRTALAAGISRDINSVSSLNGRVTLAAVDVVDGDSSLSAGLSVGYTRVLTRDWALTSGYQLNLRDGDSSASRTSNTLFVSLGRDFDLRF